MTSINDRARAMFPGHDARESALPFQAAHHQRYAEWIAGRSDPFAAVLSSMQLQHRLDHGGLMTAERSFSAQHTQEEREAAATASIPMVQADLASELEQLKDHLVRFDPLEAVSSLTVTNCVGLWGQYHEPSAEGLEAIPEIAAGVVASERRSFGGLRPGSEDAHLLNQRCREVLRLSSYLSQLKSVGGSPFERTAAFSAGQWMTIRGDSYLHHGHQVASEILTPRADWMTATFGFTFNEYLEVASAIHAVQFVDLNKAAQGERVPAAMSCERVAHFGSVDVARVKSVVERLAVGVGSIDSEYAGPYGGSPLATRPILGDTERFIVPVPGMLVRDVLRIFETDLVQKYPKFTKHRASTVDRLALDRVQEALSGSESGFELTYLHDDGDGLRHFEVDGIVKFERFLLIVEGKAGRLSDQALRGDTLRATRDLRRGLVKAQQQANRVARKIATAQETTFRDASGRELVIRRSEVDAVITLHPTLHSPGVYAFETAAVAEELGLDPAAPTILPVLLTDLFVICELTNNPATLLHYLGWRQQLRTGDSLLVLDELDLLGTYLFGGAKELTELHATGQPVMNMGSTVDIDTYYNGVIGQGPSVPLPTKYMGEWFVPGELARIAEERKRNWVETAFTILELEVPECGRLELEAEQVTSEMISPEPFCSREFGDVAVLFMSQEASFIDDAFAMSRCGPDASRRVTIRVDDMQGPRIVKASRQKQPLVAFRSLDSWDDDREGND